MPAIYIPTALIVPAAGMVNEPGLIQCTEHTHGFQGVKLPPAFVEGYPQGNTGAVIQQFNRGL